MQSNISNKFLSKKFGIKSLVNTTSIHKSQTSQYNILYL